MKDRWPAWNEQDEDSPDEFVGTVDCPLCRQTFLVIGYNDKPFCFHCNASVDAAECENCGTTHLIKDGCSWCGR
jgi:C4-type Zn-finger protein